MIVWLWKRKRKANNMFREILESSLSTAENDKIIKSLNNAIEKMIKDKNKKGLDILVKELDKVLNNLK